MDLDLLKKILSSPTAPFCEYLVEKTIKEFLSSQKIPFFKDSFGNLVVGVDSEGSYQERLYLPASEPLRIFMAHMDHPGFIITQLHSNSRAEFKWFGGSPNYLIKNAPVWIADNTGYCGEGKVFDVQFKEGGITRGVLSLRKLQSKEKRLFGGFQFKKPVWMEKNLIHTKAADDLVGVFCIVSLARQLHLSKNFIGILTRAEEVGFIGAFKHFEQGWLSNTTRKSLLISLETSRELAGASIGKGPIVRLGDRRNIFDSAGTEVLSQVAKKVLPNLHQRKIMDGGTCEASMGIAKGITSIGISIALGNYHNQVFRKDGKRSVGPEYVHINDIKGMLKLCASLMAEGLPWKNPWKNFEEDIKKTAESLSDWY